MRPWLQHLLQSASNNTQTFTITSNSTGLITGVYSTTVTITSSINNSTNTTTITIVLPVGQSGSTTGEAELHHKRGSHVSLLPAATGQLVLDRR